MRFGLGKMALVSALIACSDQPSAPVYNEPRNVAFQVVSADTHSRVTLVWDDQVTINGFLTTSGIRGDGRNRFGQAANPVNEYQGDFCGVRGFIYDGKGESGNLEVDPDTYYVSSMSAACGSRRTLSFYLSGQSAAPTIAAPHILGSPIWQLVPGEVRVQPQRFGMQLVISCGELDFDAKYAGASNVRETRLSDGVDASGAAIRRWRIESQGNHAAACIKVQTNGKFVDSGLRYYLPFGVTVTQVRYPYATFP